MKNMWKVALAAVALVGSASVAQADLTLDGQTGLFANPTAEIVKKGAPEIQANYNRLNADGEHINSFGVGFAFSPAEKLELSAGLNRASINGYHLNDSRIGLKYQFVNQAEKGFDVAAGANYGSLVEGIDQITLFAAATKAFSFSKDRAPVKGTLGVRWDRFSLGSDSMSKGSVFAGADVPLTRDGQFSLVGEVGSKVIDQGQSTYAIGVRYRPKSSGFSAALGYGRLASSGSGAFIGAESGQSFHNFFAQVGYTFGK